MALQITMVISDKQLLKSDLKLVMFGAVDYDQLDLKNYNKLCSFMFG